MVENKPALRPLKAHPSLRLSLAQQGGHYKGVEVDGAETEGRRSWWHEAPPQYAKLRTTGRWQSRMLHGQSEQAVWNDMPAAVDRQLACASEAGQSSVEVQIGGATFVMDLEAGMQYNKQHSDRVREIRFVEGLDFHWYSVTIGKGRADSFRAFDEQANRIVSTGSGAIPAADVGSELIPLADKSGRTTFVDKRCKREYTGGSDEQGRFRRLVCLPSAIADTLMVAGVLARGNATGGAMPAEHALYSQLVQAFEDTKWGTRASAPGKRVEHEHISVTGHTFIVMAYIVMAYAVMAYILH